MTEDIEFQQANELLHKTFTSDIRPGYETYRGVCLPVAFKKIADDIENFHVRDDDIFVCSFSRSGTTWTQEMVWCISSDVDLEGAKVDLGDRVPYLELSAIFDGSALVRKHPELEGHRMVRNSVEFVKNFPSPRIIKTHLPWCLLPRELREGKTKAKIVYVSRNPKESCVSFYHHARRVGFSGNLDQFCTLYLAGRVNYGPYWDHVFGFWNRKNRPNHQILCIKYEEMKSNLPDVINKVSKFLEKPALTPEKLDALVDHLSFNKMRENPAVNNENAFSEIKKYNDNVKDGDFIRKGQVDSWKTEMSPEMSAKFDQWIAKNLQSSGEVV